jgi:heptosyltransferase II
VIGPFTPPARLVVLAPNWLGDAIMALPAMADVRRALPGAHLAVAARPPVAPLFDAVPGIDGVQVLPLTGGLRGVPGLARAAALLRASRYDAALLLPNSFASGWLVHRAGIPSRWGYGGNLRDRLLTRAVPRTRDPRLHQSEYYQRLTGALGFARGPRQAMLRIAEASRHRASVLLRESGWHGEPLVGMAPGAAYGSAKRWIPSRAGELAAALARDHGAAVVIVGAAADRATGDEVVRAAAAAGYPALIDLVGRTDLSTLMGVLARCVAFVSNDSGAMHLAAALDVPVTAIFGPTREWATSPLPGASGRAATIVRTDVSCRPCMLRTCPIDHRCMTGIGVEDVRRSVEAHVRAPGDARP